MVCTLLGSKRARGKKKRRNMRKDAAMYPHTAVQMSRLRNLLTEGFPVAGPAGDFPAGALAAGFGGAATAAALGEAAGGASSGFAIINIIRLSCLLLFPNTRTPAISTE